MAYFDGIKVGDKPYSLTDGDGVVVRLSDGIYKIIVDFGGNLKSHTMEGFYSLGDKTQTLYWQKPEIIDKGKPTDKLIKGAAYWVWDDTRKFIKIYSHSENGLNYFFDHGYMDGSSLDWDNYELFKQPSAVAELSGTPEGEE